MFFTSSFLSNHYTLEKCLHPSLLLNFRPSFSVLSRDCRLSPALSLPYGSTAIRVAALVVSKMISQQRQNRRKEDAHRNFQRLLSLTASKTTALRTKQRHLEDTCASKPFRNPVGHLCLAEHSHHTLNREGLNGHTAPVADIKHTLHSSSSFSLSLFIRKDVSVWHSSLSAGTPGILGIPGIPEALPAGEGEVDFRIIFPAPAEFPALSQHIPGSRMLPSFLLPSFFPILPPQHLPFHSVFPGFAPGKRQQSRA